MTNNHDSQEEPFGKRGEIAISRCRDDPIPQAVVRTAAAEGHLDHREEGHYFVFFEDEMPQHDPPADVLVGIGIVFPTARWFYYLDAETEIVREDISILHRPVSEVTETDVWGIPDDEHWDDMYLPEIYVAEADGVTSDFLMLTEI